MGKRAQKICDEDIGMDKPKNTELKNSLEYSWASGIHLFSLPKENTLPFPRVCTMASLEAGANKMILVLF